MSCKYCRGEEPLIAITDDLAGVGAVIEGARLRVYGVYDGFCEAGDESASIGYCPKCGGGLPAEGAVATHDLADLGVPGSVPLPVDPSWQNK